MCTVVRDEIFLISDFLNHYRSIGVERFIVLDDRSQDGTRELLLAEPDVMVMESHLQFGAVIPAPANIESYRRTIRAVNYWHNQLMDVAGHERVHTMADVDEFAVLPDGMTLHDAAAACLSDPAKIILGVMLDVYPQHPYELKQMTSITDGRLYFDALPHLRLRPHKRPKRIYSGARARLYSKTGILPVQPARRRFRVLFRKRFIRKLHVLHKPILIHWRSGDSFLDSHNTIGMYTGGYSQNILLPLVHFKFVPPIFSKIRRAIIEESYFGKSEDQKRLSDMMIRIDGDPMGFMCRDSEPVTGWFGFERSGNAFGL